MPSKSTARSLVVCAALLMSLAASKSQASELLRVGNAGREAFSFTPANIGMEVGIFAKNGLHLEISGFGGDAKLQQAMAGPPLLFALVVRSDASMKTIDDLHGHRVGISTVGSATSWLMNEVSRQRGWGFGGFSLVPIGENSARIAALKSGAIDACVVDTGSALRFVQGGDGKILMRFGDVAKDFIMHVIFATDKAIAERPAALSAFLKGWFETIAFMRHNKEQSVTIAQTIMGTDKEMTNAIYDELMPMFLDNGHFDPKALAVLSRSFVEMKTLPSAPDMGKLYTEAFLPAQ